VVAHEFSHILNADMRMNVRLIAILGGILALGQLGYFMMRSMRFSGRRRSSSGSNNQMGLVIIGTAVALLVVGYIGLFFGRLIKAAISRQREFLADASAVQYSRDSMGIANALYRIKTNGKGSLLDSSHAEDMSHMCFGSALKFSAFSNMLATHPPIDERIKTLVPGYNPPNDNHRESANIDDSVLHSSFANQQPIEDALEITTPEQLVDQIGQLQPQQLVQAEVIHQSIPTQLIDYAHSLNDANLLILGLIIAGSDDHINNLTATVSEQLTTEQISTIENLVPTIELLAQNLKLPLIEMTIPVLKQFDKTDKKQLLACASLLISADNKINPFEFFLYALLRKNLSRKDADFNGTIFRKYNQVLGDIQYLTSILASASGNKSSEIVSTAMKSFDPAWKTPDILPTYNANQLNKSLNRLNRLAPMLKKPLMQTLAEIVMMDGEIKTAEIELLRTTGIYLECPVPPLY